MEWSPAPDTSFCIASGKAIFLNARADRYLTLPSALNNSFLAWLAADGVGAVPEAIALLRSAGLVVPRGVADPALAPAQVVVPREAIVPADIPSLDAIAIAGAWLGFRAARTRLRRRGFMAALEYVRAARSACAARCDPAPLAARFVRASRQVPGDGDCLVRSLALLDALHRGGSDADLVVGVLPAPFRAHCWVQDSAAILNDSSDRVAAFTPILLV